MWPAEGTLQLDEIERRLTTSTLGRAPNCPNEVWDSIGSTNTRALELAAQNAPEGVLVAARQQSSGRGRLGRSWISPPDAGLYLSVLLRPSKLAPSQIPLLTLAGGVAVSRAIESVAGITPGLKWVNDLIFDSRKIGGILAEMHSTPLKPEHSKAIVIGIGVNLRVDRQGLPKELEEIVGSLEDYSHGPVDANQLVCAIALELELVYEALQNGESEKILKQWKQRSITLGQEIVATTGSQTISGVAEDLARNGALIVRTADGGTTELHAGEVTIRRADTKYA